MGADSTRAPDGATTLTTKDDADILAAWATYKQAREVYDTTPDVGPFIEGMNAIQHEQVAIMAAAENLIAGAVANTLRGIEIQLWAMLIHAADSWEASNMALNENLEAAADHFDWVDCHALNSIRAIRAMIAKEGGAA